MKTYQRIPVLFLIITAAVVAMTAILVPLAKATPSAGQELVDNNSVAPCEVPSSYATIQAAVNDPACDIIAVGAGTFQENITINRMVTIQGQGAMNTVVDGGGIGRVFYIQSSGVVTLTNLTIRNGLAPNGGGILNAGILTVQAAPYPGIRPSNPVAASTTPATVR